MKISLAWLNEFADFGSDTNLISDRLTELGLAVESVEHVGAPVKGVVTAKVLRLEKHPDAAKVTRVFVNLTVTGLYAAMFTTIDSVEESI